MKTILSILATFLIAFSVTAQEPTLYDYYGLPFPSVLERSIPAADCGILDYSGTKKQNVQLLECLTSLGFSVATNYRTTLSSSITSSQSTIPVSSVTTQIGDTLSMAVLGDKVFFTLEPGGSKEEIILCTGLSSTTWTGCTRGLSSTGTSTATVAARRKSHNAGSTIIMSNVHYVYDELVDKDQAETIGGLKTFSQIPLIPTSTPTLGTQAVSFFQFQQATTTGGVNGSELIKGVWQGATQAQMVAGTASGSSGANLCLQNTYANATSTATTTIPITGTDGKLSQGFLDLTEDFTFSGNFTVTGTTTISDLPPVDTQIFTSSGTWTKPNGITLVEVVVLGAGGGGDSGRKTVAATNRAGGGGGGGGAVSRAIFLASNLGATTTITVGAGGAGGAAVSADATDGNDGSNGGSSSFSTWLSAGGGGGGIKGTTAASKGGGGGGVMGSGSGFTGGVPSAGAADAIASQGTEGVTNGAFNAEYGGGTGGSGLKADPGEAGGSSWYGSAGGGGGSGLDGGDSTSVGGAGGTVQKYTVVGGAAAGVAGSDNSVLAKGYGGSGGGGGDSSTGTGETGGAGGIGAGGGGGGASKSGNSGAGGNGGAGEVRVYSW